MFSDFYVFLTDAHHLRVTQRTVYVPYHLLSPGTQDGFRPLRRCLYDGLNQSCSICCSFSKGSPLQTVVQVTESNGDVSAESNAAESVRTVYFYFKW